MPSDQDAPDAILTTQQAAERLGVSIIRVRQYITSGRLPASKVGRDYLIRSVDVAHFERRRTGRPTKHEPKEQGE